jgi:hypothetical protein
MATPTSTITPPAATTSTPVNRWMKSRELEWVKQITKSTKDLAGWMERNGTHLGGPGLFRAGFIAVAIGAFVVNEIIKAGLVGVLWVAGRLAKPVVKSTARHRASRKVRLLKRIGRGIKKRYHWIMRKTGLRRAGFRFRRFLAIRRLGFQAFRIGLRQRAGLLLTRLKLGPRYDRGEYLAARRRYNEMRIGLKSVHKGKHPLGVFGLTQTNNIRAELKDTHRLFRDDVSRNPEDIKRAWRNDVRSMQGVLKSVASEGGQYIRTGNIPMSYYRELAARVYGQQTPGQAAENVKRSGVKLR